MYVCMCVGVCVLEGEEVFSELHERDFNTTLLAGVCVCVFVYVRVCVRVWGGGTRGGK